MYVYDVLLVVSSLVTASGLPQRLPGDVLRWGWGSCAQCGQRIAVFYMLPNMKVADS